MPLAPLGDTNTGINGISSSILSQSNSFKPSCSAKERIIYVTFESKNTHTRWALPYQLAVVSASEREVELWYPFPFMWLEQGLLSLVLSLQCDTLLESSCCSRYLVNRDFHMQNLTAVYWRWQACTAEQTWKWDFFSRTWFATVTFFEELFAMGSGVASRPRWVCCWPQRRRWRGNKSYLNAGKSQRCLTRGHKTGN